MKGTGLGRKCMCQTQGWNLAPYFNECGPKGPNKAHQGTMHCRNIYTVTFS